MPSSFPPDSLKYDCIEKMEDYACTLAKILFFDYHQHLQANEAIQALSK